MYDKNANSLARVTSSTFLLKKGYTESEVVTAVISSIQAGLQLRSYLEG